MKRIQLEDIHYYFDAQERDVVDCGSKDSRAHAIAQIRNQLLRLPQEDFERAVSMIQKIIEPSKESEQGQQRWPQSRKDSIDSQKAVARLRGS